MAAKVVKMVDLNIAACSEHTDPILVHHLCLRQRAFLEVSSPSSCHSLGLPCALVFFPPPVFSLGFLSHFGGACSPTSCWEMWHTFLSDIKTETLNL